MTEPVYLIAHKVYGEPAFDVAVQMTVEGYDEPWWIVSTSGHRAFPYWYELLRPVGVPEMPADLPEHYASEKVAPRSVERAKTDELINLLGD